MMPRRRGFTVIECSLALMILHDLIQPDFDHAVR